MTRALPRAFAFLLAVACSSDRLPSGSPCTDPFSCQTGLCLERRPGERVCAQRCSDVNGCPSGEVCGRFDFRGRDDSGALAGPKDDIVRVCRPALNRRCTEGCGLPERCVGDTDGVCSNVCRDRAECGGRECVRDGCATGVCAPPCDHIAECPRYFVCDLAHVDADGHGQCVPITATKDAGTPPFDVTCAPDA